MDLDKLKAAINETERIAQRALNGPFVGLRPVGYTDYRTSPPAQGEVVQVSILPITWDEPRIAPIHVAYDPASVLRMVAAHRKILDLHAGTHECPALDHHGKVDGFALALDGDCLTIHTLAEGYGIEP